MPKVSIILTSFNHAKYLHEAIDSVLNQTFSDWELIIWDDASIDESWQIIKKYDDPRITSFRNDRQRRGIYGINKAITEHVKSDFIAIHHSDDVWEPDKLAKQVACIEKNSDVGAVFTHVKIIDEAGNQFKDKNHFYAKIFEQPNRTRHEWLRYFFTTGNALCHPSVLIRRGCYDDCGLYRPGLAQLPDLDMWIRLCMKYPIHIIQEKLVRFRVRDNEANSSGNLPINRTCHNNEFYQLLKNYLNIQSYDELCMVFSEAQSYRSNQCECGIKIKYSLARVAFELKSSPMVVSFGLDILYELLSDPTCLMILEREFQFGPKELVSLSGQYDVWTFDQAVYLASELVEVLTFNRKKSKYYRGRRPKLTEFYKDLHFVRHELKKTSNQLLLENHRRQRLQKELENVLTSSSWKITKCLRWARRLFSDFNHWYPILRCNLFADKGKKYRGEDKYLPSVTGSTNDYACSNDFFISPSSSEEKYASWLRVNQFNLLDEEKIIEKLSSLGEELPKISVIIPVYNTSITLLKAAISSVMEQIYQKWEICIVDDGSSNKDIPILLNNFAMADSRVKVVICEGNGGISKATNTAVSMATGEVLAFLDHDDLLTIDALAEIALYYGSNTFADIVYSDDDKIDHAGERFAPQFKPDYSPILLLHYMYFSHLFTVKKTLYTKLGGFRPAFDGSQDYDFALRAVEKAKHVGHVPKILYHWRVVPGSTAESGNAKPESFEAGRKAVAEAMVRRNVKGGWVKHPHWAASAGVGIFSLAFSDTGPSVSIIIPTKNNVTYLRTCILSLKTTTYKNYEIIVIDNESDDIETIAYLEELSTVKGCRIVQLRSDNNKFNFANIMNRASKQSDADYLLFLNDDTKVISPVWLSQMVGYICMKGVGAVGAQLLFEDDSIQHAGIVHGFYDGMAGPAFRGQSADDWGYLAYLKVAREYSAVTAACMLTPRKLFMDIGGFDEKVFQVAYNDVDYCYRLIDAGYFCVYCPGAKLYHYEGKSRGFSDDPREIVAFKKKYFSRVDYFYNPNLSLENENFQILASRHDPAIEGPIRVVMASHNLNHEGAPNSMFELVGGLKKMGVIEPIIISPVDGPLREKYEALGVTVRIVTHPLTDSLSVEYFNDNIVQLGADLIDMGIELVYGNTLETYWIILVARSLGLPAIWNVRESESWDTYFNAYPVFVRQLAYSVFSYPYKIIFVANSTSQAWQPLNEKNNFTVIKNGLDRERLYSRAVGYEKRNVREELGVLKNEIIVLLLGTVCERKSQLDFLHAISLLPKETLTRAKYYIVGDRAGEYSDKLHEFKDSLPSSVKSRVFLIKETNEPYYYFRASDIFVCTSRLESYPRVILEAMAFDLPIITTPVFGIVEQVKENRNALFYPYGDSKFLSESLVRLIEDEGLREYFSGNSRYVLESLEDYRGMVNKYADIFQSAASCFCHREQNVCRGVAR